MHYLRKYGVGLFVGCFLWALLFIVQALPSRAISLVSLIAGMLLLSVAYVFFAKQQRWHEQKNILTIMLFTLIAVYALIFVIDFPFIRSLVSFFMSICFGMFFVAGVDHQDGKWYSPKPFRRFLTLMLLFDAYAFATLAFAMYTFFPSDLLFLIVSFITAILIGIITMITWQYYIDAQWKSFTLWMLIIVLIVFELFWVVHLLPYVYYMLALCVIWPWYLVQMLARYHFTKRGIEWKKQIPRLLVHVGLFLIVLFYFIRWV